MKLGVDHLLLQEIVGPNWIIRDSDSIIDLTD